MQKSFFLNLVEWNLNNEGTSINLVLDKLPDNTEMTHPWGLLKPEMFVHSESVGCDTRVLLC